MNETIVLYHGGCRDGFCAAWVVNKYFNSILHSSDLEIEKNIQYIPAFYGQEPPDVTGKDVIIVDFCYSIDVMFNLFSEAKSLIWLDHHKTATEVMIDMMDNPKWAGLRFNFDIRRSGAGIAWDYFFPNEPRPWLVDYVEDRDLWKKQLYETNKVNSLIACLEFNFKVWDYWNQIDYPGNPGHELIAFGKIAEMKTEQYVREVCKNIYFADIKNPNFELFGKEFSEHEYRGTNIPTVNICQVDCSEVLHELCKLYPLSPFSLYWFKRADGMYQYGMRSIGDFDVSSVAKLFGGGGHKNAAGFQLKYLLEELK